MEKLRVFHNITKEFEKGMDLKNRETQKEIAARLGIKERTLRRYKSIGIDIYNDAAVMEYWKLQQLPSEKDAEFLGMDVTEITKREKIARTRDKEAAAELKELQLSKLRGDLVSVSDVEEINLAIAGKIKAQLKRLISEIPPRVEGLDATTMTPIVREYIEDILKYLYEEFKIDDDEEEEKTV